MMNIEGWHVWATILAIALVVVIIVLFGTF
jgi:hypothetical protein